MLTQYKMSFLFLFYKIYFERVIFNAIKLNLFVYFEIQYLNFLE